jgi:hypothetical protein
MSRDSTRSKYREGDRGCLLRPDKEKRMTDRTINRIVSLTTMSCFTEIAFLSLILAPSMSGEPVLSRMRFHGDVSCVS